MCWPIWLAGDHRPYLVLNMVATADGAATVAQRSAPISNRADRQLFHELRSHVDWTPAVDTDLRLAAFAAEESVATLCAAAATGHTGPDVLSMRLLSKLGLVTHRMILEYRTLFRAAWTDMEACGRSAAHDADARLTTVPASEADGPGGPWRHALLLDGRTVEVSMHAGLPAVAASVAAQRAVDEHSIRWAAPVAAVPGSIPRL